MSDQNKAIARRFFDKVWMGKLDVADELLDASYVGHGLPPGMPPGPEGFKLFVSMYRSAFPDVQYTVEDQIAEGDRVVTRWTARGTHKGELMGIPPTGKQAVVTGISISRFVGGKAVEGWDNWDGLGMMQQLGVVPAMGQGGQ
jgi:predicted ester cyclase